MRKHVIALAAVALLGWSVQSLAADLETDMDTIADNYTKVLKTDNKADFIAGLAKMKAAAQDAKKSKPPKFDSKPDNSPEIQDYHKGLDDLISHIDKASALANADKLAEAKQEAEGLKAIRNENHKKFK